MRGVDKRVAQGTEELLTRNEWCSVMGIHGKDPDVLLHPTMELAFSRILERFKPKHRVAYLGLCSSIRPYSQSRKWAVVAPLLQDKADLIITSNGGVIPIEYEGAFSYLNYDAHGHSRYDDLYIKVLTKRLLAFFRTHRYETLCFHYRVGLRNREAARIGGGAVVAGGSNRAVHHSSDGRSAGSGAEGGLAYQSPRVQDAP